MLFYIKINPEYLSGWVNTTFLRFSAANILITCSKSILMSRPIGRKQAQRRKLALAGASSEERFHSAQSAHTPFASAGCHWEINNKIIRTKRFPKVAYEVAANVFWEMSTSIGTSLISVCRGSLSWLSTMRWMPMQRRWKSPLLRSSFALCQIESLCPNSLLLISIGISRWQNRCYHLI